MATLEELLAERQRRQDATQQAALGDPLAEQTIPLGPERPPLETAPARAIDLEQLQAERAKRSIQNLSPDQTVNLLLGGFPDIAKDIVGAGQAGLTLLSGEVAKPIAGAAGLQETIANDAIAGAERVKQIEQELTIPPGQLGQEKLTALQNELKDLSQNPIIADVIRTSTGVQDLARQQVGQFGEFLADPINVAAREIGIDEPESESAFVGRGIAESLVTAVPQTALEVGVPAGLRSVSKAATRTLNDIPSPSIIEDTTGGITKISRQKINEVAPINEQLRNAASDIYRQIDNSGVVLKPTSFNSFADRVITRMREEGFIERGFPKVAGAIDEINLRRNTPQTTTDISSLRRVAKNAADSIDKSEARLGSIMRDEFTKFLEDLTPAQVTGGRGENLGRLFRDAGELWRRSNKSEMINDALRNADLAASGIQAGLKAQFRSLLKNKKKRRAFNQQEIAAMEEIVKGGRTENVLNFVGKTALSEAQRLTLLTALGGGGLPQLVPLVQLLEQPAQPSYQF